MIGIDKNKYYAKKCHTQMNFCSPWHNIKYIIMTVLIFVTELKLSYLTLTLLSNTLYLPGHFPTLPLPRVILSPPPNVDTF